MAESPEAPLERIAAMRPRLATADRLLPYLRRIDESRLYSNFGPLALEFEDRLRRHWALPEGTVVSASSGLAALVGAILGTAGRATPARPMALVPDYTFIATASAVELCGYRPALVDVRADDWQVDPVALLAHPDLERVGVVVPVAPYGRPVAAAPWLAFRERTGIPVVIDGAACFDTLRADAGATPFPLPVALSFHATKSLGTGEGGGVVCSDLDALARIGRALNFGFESVRDCRSANTNGKMSEYTAAVGLAELDGWEAKHAAFLEVASHYRAQAQARGIAGSLHLAPDIACNYALFLADDADAAKRACARLLAAGIEYRHWYGLGLHRQTYCAGFAAQPRPVTDDIAPRLIGLPMAPDLTPSAVARVLDAIAGGGTGARA
jgi:dTDP-4-amino-4,6-dideoxygalactose transaminase